MPAHAHADERKPASIGVVYGWDLSQRRLEVAHLRVVAVRIVDEERVSPLVRRKLRRSDNQIAVRCQVLPDHGILRDVVRLAEPVQDDGEESAGRTRIARRRDRRAQQTRVGRCVTHRLFQTVRAVGELTIDRATDLRRRGHRFEIIAERHRAVGGRGIPQPHEQRPVADRAGQRLPSAAIIAYDVCPHAGAVRSERETVRGCGNGRRRTRAQQAESSERERARRREFQTARSLHKRSLGGPWRRSRKPWGEELSRLPCGS